MHEDTHAHHGTEIRRMGEKERPNRAGSRGREGVPLRSDKVLTPRVSQFLILFCRIHATPLPAYHPPGEKLSALVEFSELLQIY